MSAVTEVLDNLTREVTETRGAVQSAIAFINGVPDLVRAAVEEALAANPGVDLSALNALATDLDSSQAELVAALSANSATPAEPPFAG